MVIYFLSVFPQSTTQSILVLFIFIGQIPRNGIAVQAYVNFESCYKIAIPNESSHFPALFNVWKSERRKICGVSLIGKLSEVFFVCLFWGGLFGLLFGLFSFMICQYFSQVLLSIESLIFPLQICKNSHYICYMININHLQPICVTIFSILSLILTLLMYLLLLIFKIFRQTTLFLGGFLVFCLFQMNAPTPSHFFS